MRTRLLFLLVVMPLGALGRPLWRRRLGLRLRPRAQTYWRSRNGRPIDAGDLRSRA